tara:strand:+ start:1076 stop:1411 length:336 start_codon:yes stop_codon:yes gene_type:complete
MLKYAKSLGDYLIVGIDTSSKVKNDKGPNRPYNSTDDRMFALECIKFVDEVKIFNSKQNLELLIKQINPDYMVIGSDWKGKQVVGQKYAKNLVFFDRIGEYSTTNILENKK